MPTSPPQFDDTETFTSKQDRLYFALSAEELAKIPQTTAVDGSWGPFETELLSALTAAFKTGCAIVRARVAHGFEFIPMNSEKGFRAENISTSQPFEIDTSTAAGMLTFNYIQNTASERVTDEKTKAKQLRETTFFNGDKFCSLRMRSPSMFWVIANHREFRDESDDLIQYQCCMFQRAIWRVFCWGTGPVDLQSLHIIDFNNKPDLKKIIHTIEDWVHNRKLPMPVYGQLMIEKSKIAGMVTGLWLWSGLIAKGYQWTMTPEQCWDFDYTYKITVDCKMTSIGKNSLLAWLLCCDLVDFNVIHQPTFHDLALHLQHATTSGPQNGLKAVKEWAGGAEPIGGVEIALRKVVDCFQNPPEEGELRDVADECEHLQARQLNGIDVEHGLCKISRMLGKAKKGKN